MNGGPLNTPYHIDHKRGLKEVEVGRTKQFLFHRFVTESVLLKCMSMPNVLYVYLIVNMDVSTLGNELY